MRQEINYQNDLHQILRVGRTMERLDKSCIQLVIAQGILPWQPILQAK